MNLNDEVEVTLTAFGKYILDSHRKRCELEVHMSLKGIFQYDKEGKYKVQLWELFEMFGSHIYMDATQVFVNNEIRVVG